MQTRNQDERSFTNVSNEISGQWKQPVIEQPLPNQFEIPVFETSSHGSINEQQPPKVIPIKPIMPENLEKELNIMLPPDSPGISNQVNTSLGTFSGPNFTNQTTPQPISNSTERKPINQIAAEALKASQLLSELSKRDSVDPRQEKWDQSCTDSINQIGYGSLDAAVRDSKVTSIASEFTEQINPFGNDIKPIEVQQVPFGV
jgi:hypothetical protein